MPCVPGAVIRACVGTVHVGALFAVCAVSVCEVCAGDGEFGSLDVCEATAGSLAACARGVEAAWRDAHQENTVLCFALSILALLRLYDPSAP